ncbi:MAG TPA: rhodanese-like domain-containing protein [Streptosporangiaceae bacterium]
MDQHQQSMREVPAADVPDHAYLVDVRENDEWTAGHAPGAQHIPLGLLASRCGEIPQDRELYVICRSGGRSAHATHVLNAGGWQAVNVADGMLGWESAGRPMHSESGGAPFVA